MAAEARSDVDEGVCTTRSMCAWEAFDCRGHAPSREARERPEVISNVEPTRASPPRRGVPRSPRGSPSSSRVFTRRASTNDPAHRGGFGINQLWLVLHTTGPFPHQLPGNAGTFPKKRGNGYINIWLSVYLRLFTLLIFAKIYFRLSERLSRVIAHTGEIEHAHEKLHRLRRATAPAGQLPSRFALSLRLSFPGAAPSATRALRVPRRPSRDGGSRGSPLRSRGRGRWRRETRFHAGSAFRRAPRPSCRRQLSGDGFERADGVPGTRRSRASRRGSRGGRRGRSIREPP